MKKYYSGKNSVKFWNKINSMECMALYIEGVKLQDQEDKVHKLLKEHPIPKSLDK